MVHGCFWRTGLTCLGMELEYSSAPAFLMGRSVRCVDNDMCALDSGRDYAIVDLTW